MNKIKKRVLIAGTFDLIHAGHIFLINEAAKLGNVFVVVATDKNREMFSGERPIIPQEQRLEVIKSIKNVKDARIGRNDNDTLKTVQDINPDIILLGPDQRYSIEILKKELKKRGLSTIKIKRLESYYDKYELHSSSLIKKKIIDRFKENNKNNINNE
ncbi:MAG: adenylyltransferase/cytidyltransferase family protein [Promethearchaeota archaeon]|jgi:FAD synthetase